MKFVSDPFNHIVIDGFLPEAEFEKIKEIYTSLQFYEKKSDLFHFYQTKELNQNKELKFFTDKIANNIHVLEQNPDKSYEEYWFNTFASFYKSGNYLLCHDDKLENRLFAFSYYLDDYETGELVLFNDSANNEVKRVNVKKNRMVIFEVSDVSFHEVAICRTDGRRAFTGWYNDPNKTNTPTKLFKKQGFDLKPEPVIFFDKILDDCMLMEITDYDFTYSNKKLVGPFTERKVSLLYSDNLVAPIITGHSIFKSHFYQFSEGNYILLQNDEASEDEKDIWDIFVMFSHDSRIFEQPFITYVESDGDHAFDLTFATNSLYAVRRRDLSFFVPRTDYEFILAHFILRKD
ncbi:putative component of NuA3 histone acetyltransferase complex [Pseudoloma neurophilia]|uniref:Putative component of NuA3 histone acetyltransferase complex n=1 Tax=Pseudoloma neurophilia TaxID=146866 RepID=A0A0R0M4S3_9MICR|nr:putative component of NuA3 histone acetyltransferase complex [Pseudoloma neurophilia]